MSDPQSTAERSGFVRKRADDIEYREVDAGEGMSKGILLDASDGAPNFAMRRFVLAPGATVPRHTNEVEHEQYVLEGEYTVGVREPSEGPSGGGDGGGGDGGSGGGAAAGEELTVSTGDAMLIPSGVVHWYRNESEEPAAFVCVVPHGDDTIRVLDG